jgi:hypothetical protein
MLDPMEEGRKSGGSIFFFLEKRVAIFVKIQQRLNIMSKSQNNNLDIFTYLNSLILVVV